MPRLNYVRTAETKFQRELRLALARHDWESCWGWPHAKLNGYGFVRIDKRPLRVHRVAYELLVGPIPDGMCLDHLCRNRACFNPKHLEVVTRGENVLRGDGIAAKNASKTHCKRGHPLAGDNLLLKANAYGMSRQCRTCRNERQRRKCA